MRALRARGSHTVVLLCTWSYSDPKAGLSLHAPAWPGASVDGTHGEKRGVCMHQHGPALLLTALTVRSSAMASGSVAWRVEPVEPLGDCLFVAVAVAEAYARSGAVLPYGAPGRSSLAQSLRLACNDLLCPGGVPSTEPLKGQDIPPSLLIETLPGESPRGYCKRLRQKGQWGSAAELAALAVVLDRQINVFVKDDSAAGLGAPYSNSAFWCARGHRRGRRAQ